MKKILGLFVLALLFSGLVVCVEGEDKFRLDYSVSVYDPLNRPAAEDVYCVNTTLYVNVTNHNTHKPLNNAEVTAYLNGTQAKVDAYTNYNGVAYVTIREPGVYRLRIMKTTYKTELTGERFDFIICTSTTSTTTTTTTKTTFAEETTSTTFMLPSTTLPASSTTSTVSTVVPSTSTTIMESCSDGVKNQGEEGVDCGGSCSPCSSMDLTGILFAVFLLGIFGLFAYFIVKGRPKEKGKSKIGGHTEHKHHDHSTNHREAK